MVIIRTKSLSNELAYLGNINPRIISHPRQAIVVFVRRQFSCCSKLLKGLEKTESGARPRESISGWKNFGTKQLQTASDSVFAAAEIDIDVMNTVVVQDGEIVPAGFWVGAAATAVRSE